MIVSYHHFLIKKNTYFRLLRHSNIFTLLIKKKGILYIYIYLKKKSESKKAKENKIKLYYNSLFSFFSKKSYAK